MSFQKIAPLLVLSHYWALVLDIWWCIGSQYPLYVQTWIYGIHLPCIICSPALKFDLQGVFFFWGQGWYKSQRDRNCSNSAVGSAMEDGIWGWAHLSYICNLWHFKLHLSVVLMQMEAILIGVVDALLDALKWIAYIFFNASSWTSLHSFSIV